LLPTSIYDNAGMTD